MAQVVRKDLGETIQIPIKTRNVGGSNDGELRDNLGSRVEIQDPDGNDVTPDAGPRYVVDGHALLNWDTSQHDPSPGPGDYLVTVDTVLGLDVDGNRVEKREAVIYRLTKQGAR